MDAGAGRVFKPFSPPLGSVKHGTEKVIQFLPGKKWIG